MQTLHVHYSTIKNILTTIPSYYVPQGDGGYDIIAVGSEILIRNRLYDSDSSDISDFETNFKSKCISVHSSDDALVLGNVANGIPFLSPRTNDGRMRVSSEKPSGTRTNFYSHNFSDKTTWYSQSVRVVDEIATDDGDHINYSLNHQFIIDMYHGKITQEDDLKDANNYSYRISVKVNSVIKIEQDPHLASGNDFIVNYAEGKIAFLNPLNGEDEVKVTYHYANGSRFTIKPSIGTTLSINLAEAQFSIDVDPKDSIIFEQWGIIDYYKPSLVLAGFVPTGTMVKLGRLIYKTMNDFYNDTFRAYPTYPPLGSEGNWRAQSKAVTVLDWDYEATVPLSYIMGTEIRVYLEHDIPFDGYLSTATFYCISTKE